MGYNEGVANWSSVRLIIEGKQVQFLSPSPSSF